MYQLTYLLGLYTILQLRAPCFGFIFGIYIIEKSLKSVQYSITYFSVSLKLRGMYKAEHNQNEGSKTQDLSHISLVRFKDEG